jgi:citronellol/citronellal dehydrogenase
MATLKDKTIVITGASRGIGRAIALRCAQDGANLVLAAKSLEPHPKLPGTLLTVAEEVKKAGGNPLVVQTDVRDEAQVKAMAEKAATEFGTIHAVVNNAGAIWLQDTANTPMKRFDLMFGVNVRAAFMCVQACLPWLEKAGAEGGAHILNLSPPISLKDKWFENHVAYTASKFSMTMMALGQAAELREKNIAANTLWPKTAIWTAAVAWLMGEEAKANSRKPDIMADAAHEILLSKPSELTGQMLVDEDFLKTRGVTDFEPYAYEPGAELIGDLFVET